MVDWNHNGERDSFDFAMDMMAMEEMERASKSKKSSYNSSYKSTSSSSSDDAFYMGCTMYFIFMIFGPICGAVMFLAGGEGGIALGIIAIGVIVNIAVPYFFLGESNSSSQSSSTAQSSSAKANSIAYDAVTDFQYTFRGQSVAITGYVKTDRAVIKIPTMIQYMAVQHIDTGAFQQCKALRKIIIPQYVESISINAFASTKNLTIYGLPDSYAQQFAQEYGIAFKDVKDFDESDHSQTVASQGVSVKTESATIKHTVQSTPVKSLGDYDVVIENGCITIKKFTGIDKPIQTVPKMIDDIPVWFVDTGAYLNCKHIEKVIIPEGVLAISNGAFRGCDKLREVVLAKSLQMIGQDAFPHGQDIIFYCYGGSYGLEYVRQYKYEYRDAEDMSPSEAKAEPKKEAQQEATKETKSKYSASSSGFTGSAHQSNCYQSSARTSSYAAGLASSALLLDDDSADDTDWSLHETTRDRLDFDLIGSGYDSYDLEWMDEDEREDVLWDNGLDPYDYDFDSLDD